MTTYRRILTLIALLAFIPGVSGCLDDLPSKSKVVDLRLLAIRADPPQATGGDSIMVSALVAQPGEAQVRYQWAACVTDDSGKIAGGFGFSPTGAAGKLAQVARTCLDLVELDPDSLIAEGTGETLAFDVPTGFLSDPKVLAAAYGISAIPSGGAGGEGGGIPDTIDFASLILDLLEYAGVNISVWVRITDGERTIESFKRVNIALPSTEVNTNPLDLVIHAGPQGEGDDRPVTAAAVPERHCFVGEVAGTPVVLTPGALLLTPLNIPDPMAEYTVILPQFDVGDPYTKRVEDENYFYSWFSTQGSFGRLISKASQTRGDTIWNLPKTAEEPIDLWVVVRDGRGGTDWCHSQVMPEVAATP